MYNYVHNPYLMLISKVLARIAVCCSAALLPAPPAPGHQTNELDSTCNYIPCQRYTFTRYRQMTDNSRPGGVWASVASAAGAALLNLWREYVRNA